MRFRELSNGQTFEFANRPNGAEIGPWVKVSARGYEPASVLHRLNGTRLQVGSINVDVTPVAWPEV